MTDPSPETPVYSHGRPTVRGIRGMVTSAHPLATMAGIRTLQQGGNAFDAIADTVDGPNASGVPGNLAGWCFLVRELGRLGLPEVFAPAIEYAAEGFPTSVFFREMTETGFGRQMQPEWGQLYVDGTGGAAVNVPFRQPDLARTLTAIAEEGPDHLYDGPLGEKMVAHLRQLGMGGSGAGRL